MTEVRCECGKLLFKASGAAQIQIKCPRCKEIRLIELNTRMNEEQARKELVGATD